MFKFVRECKEQEDHPVQDLLLDALQVGTELLKEKEEEKKETEEAKDFALFSFFVQLCRKSLRSIEFLSYEKIIKKTLELNRYDLCEELEGKRKVEGGGGEGGGRWEQSVSVLLRGAASSGRISLVQQMLDVTVHLLSSPLLSSFVFPILLF